jgi:hypothetical protein
MVFHGKLVQTGHEAEHRPEAVLRLLSPDVLPEHRVRSVHVAPHFVCHPLVHNFKGIPRRAAHLARRLLWQQLQKRRSTWGLRTS